MTRKMTAQRRAWLSGTMCALMLGGMTLAGCGGGGGDDNKNPAPNPAGAAVSVETGRTQLNALITDGRHDNTSLQTMQASFQSAYNQDNNNTQAAMGLGIADVAVAAQNLVNTVQLNRAKSTGKAAQTSDVLTQTAQNVLPWKLQAFNEKTGFDTLSTALTVPQKISGLHRQVDLNALRSSLTGLKNALDTAIPLVQKAANQSDFAFAMVDFQHNNTGTITMDQADAQSFLAGLHAARAILEVALAYDFNYGTFNFNQTLDERFSGKTIGGKITPDEYLPAAPFGNLTSDGKSFFKGAQNDLIAAADTAQAALTSLRNRATPVGHLIPSADITGTDYQDAQNGIAVFKNALASPYTTPGSSVTLNAAAWFNNPPSSLRALLPTYTVQDSGNGTGYASATAASFPDPTFGGLVTGAKIDETRIYGYQSLGDLASVSGY